jgi:hypothetical protein
MTASLSKLQVKNKQDIAVTTLWKVLRVESNFFKFGNRWKDNIKFCHSETGCK